jgi:predicted dithiol-disulfide oxidoreductase (DUF899 family)
MSRSLEAILADIAKLQAEATLLATSQPVEPIRDYTLHDVEARPVTLRQLFEGKRDLLVVHNMGRSCAYCALWADGFIGLAPHIIERAGFALTSPDDPATLKATGARRGWNFRCVSIAGTTFATDLGYDHAKPDGSRGYLPGVSAFHLEDDGQVVRTGHAPFGRGDQFCAIWPMFALLRGGDAGWEPRRDQPMVTLGIEPA